MFMVLFTLGILIAVQINSTTRTQHAEEEKMSTQLEDYQSQVNDLADKIELLKDECAKLDADYTVALKAVEESDREYQDLFIEYEKDIEHYKKFAGLLTVTGSGLDIGIDDAQKIHGQYGTFLVHDVFLVEIINVLKIGGAQAIAINGQRVLAMTECVCLGPSIRVNGERLFAPYHVEAIGDPQKLMEAFINSQIYNEMKKQELIIDPVIKDKIVINKYNKKITSAISTLTDKDS